MGEQFSDPNREAVGLPPIMAEGEQTPPRPSKYPKGRTAPGEPVAEPEVTTE